MNETDQDASPANWLLASLDRRRHWIFVALGLLLAAGYNGQWRISPDSALYVELGRNLAEGAGFTYHGQPHTWVEPGLPYSIGTSFRLFGVDNFHPLMLVMLACSGACLALTYALFIAHVGRPTAVLMVTLLGLCETFYRYGFHLFTDMPFLLGVLVFLLAYEWILHGKRHWLAWPMIVVAILYMTAVRPVVLTFIGAVGVATAWHVLRGPMRWRHAMIGALVLATFVGFRLVDPRRGDTGKGELYRESMLKSLLSDRLGAAVHRMVVEWVPKMLEETTMEAIFSLQSVPGLNSVISVVIIAAGVALVRRRVLWGAWVAATMAQLVFWRPMARYFLPVMPLVLFAMWELGLWLSRRRKLNHGFRNAIPIAIVVLLILPNLFYIVKFAVEQQRRPFLVEYEHGQKLELIELAGRIRSDVPADAHVIADHARELSYFSRMDIVDPMTTRRVPPTQAEYDHVRDDLAARTTHVYVVEPGVNTHAMVERLGGVMSEKPLLSWGEYTIRQVTFTPSGSAAQPETRAVPGSSAPLP